MTTERSPFIVGIGGTAITPSSTEQALNLALAAAQSRGARVKIFGGATLSQLPLYLTAGAGACRVAQEFVADVRTADGIIIASPGYHGSVSGMVKNAIDYLEETSNDARAYLDGVPVGLISTAYGWQATSSTLAALRSIVHALRGWPTPLGASINSASKPFENGSCTDASVQAQLDLVGRQVYEFAMLHIQSPETTQA